MAIVSIEQAMKLVNKSRSTIQRYIKSGKLSRTEDGIDTAELLRVFGELKQINELVKNQVIDNSMSERERWLTAQIESLQKDMKELKQESLEREKRLMALLEHQSSRVSSGGIFGGLFGKN